MFKLKMAIGKFLVSSNLIIDNSLSDTVVRNALAGYGFSGDKLLGIKKLYNETEALHSLQKQKYGEQMEATAELQKAWKTAKQQYMKTLKIARIAFRKNIKAEYATILHGIRKQSLSAWLAQAQLFYTNILGDSELMDALSDYGYTPEKLKEEAALIEAVMEKHAEQQRMIGEAQITTAARDEKIAELAKRISDLKAVARVALTDNPQQLEKLGIVVKAKR